MSTKNLVPMMAAVFAVVLLTGPAWTQESPPTPPPGFVPAAVSDSEAFTPVAIEPVAVEGPKAVAVDMSKVPVVPSPAKSIRGLRTHIQGEFVQGRVVPPAARERKASSRGEPTAVLGLDRLSSGPGGVLKAQGQEVVGFEGIPASGFIPPDTVIAVGREYIVECVNSGFRVFTKTGVETRGHTDFESFVNLPTPWDGGVFDPRVVYDRLSRRFVILVLGKDDTNLTSWFWVLVSQTNNPNGDWWIYRYNATTGTPGAEQWLDYASLGTDGAGVYVVGNSFGFAEGSGFQESQLWTLNRDMIYGGDADGIFWSDLRWPNNDQAFALQVAYGHTFQGIGATYFINNYPAAGTQVCLWTYTGERHFGQGNGDATLARAAIDARLYYAIYNNVDQPGSDWDIDGGDCRIQNAVSAFDKVYTTFALDWNAGREYSEVYVAAFNADDATKAWDYSLWNPDYFMFYPAITIEGTDLEPNWMIAMSMTVPDDPLGYAGTVVVTHDPATGTGTFDWDRVGLGPYSIWDGPGFVEGTGRNRWGDYSMATWDVWCDTAWGAAEYAAFGNTYGTRIFARTIDDEPLCRYILLTSQDDGEPLLAGSTVEVNWMKMNIPTNDEIWVRFHDGWTQTDYGPLPSGATSYTWTVPNVQTSLARIFIEAWDPVTSNLDAFDDNDILFTVNGLPDLAAPVLDPQKTGLCAGQSMDVYNSLLNTGPVEASPFNVELRWSPDTDCTTDDTLLDVRFVTGVDAGALNFSTNSITVPLGTPLGTHYLCMMIDPAGGVAEFDESNNTTYEEVSVLDPSIFADGFESGDETAWSS